MTSPEADGSSVSERIKIFNANRLPDKVQLKYQMMSVDPFRFYRGTCHLFYQDLSRKSFPTNGPNVWLSGDLHLENFGSFKGDNRLVYFDLNDFDEAILGPASWEILRITTSILVAFDTLSISEKKALKAVHLFLKHYSSTLASGKSRYLEIQTARGIVRTFLRQVAQREPAELLQKRVELKKDRLVFRIDNKKQFKIEKELKEALLEHIRIWALNNEKRPYDYKVLDAAFRIAGTGSLGAKRYVFLLESMKTKKVYWLLDMKQALPSSLAPYIQTAQPAWQTEADRVNQVKYRMQNVSPALLSNTVFQDDSYIIQELQPMEDKIDFNLIKDRYDDVEEVIRDFALLTASAQLRSSGRQGSCIADELTEFGHEESWHDKVIDYAVNYASQVKSDYLQYLQHYREGYFQ